MKTVSILIWSILLIVSGCTGTPTATTPIPVTTAQAFAPTATQIVMPSVTSTNTSTAIPTQTKTPTVTALPPVLVSLPEVGYKVYGINLGPFLHGDPNNGVYVNESDLKALIETVAPYTTSIRTYGCENGLSKAAKIAHEMNLTIAAGVWLSKDLQNNEREMACIINLAKDGGLLHSDLAVIGNETLLRGDLTEQALLVYINRFKSEIPWVPVTSAESSTVLEKYRDLIAAVDVVAVNIYPYWNNTDIQKAAMSVGDWFMNFRRFVNDIAVPYGYTDSEGNLVIVEKEILISETGWPSCGKNGSVPQESFYFGSFISFARAYDLKFYWFEAFDEAWKAKYEGEAGGCWGLWDAEGYMKKNMGVVFSGVVGGVSTPEIEISSPPDVEDWNSVRGMAWHVIPKDFRVVVYVYVPNAGGWWVKPYLDQPLTEIADTGYWETLIVTGGSDDTATKVAAFLIPVDYSPPLATGWESLPKELFDAAVANTEATIKR